MRIMQNFGLGEIQNDGWGWEDQRPGRTRLYTHSNKESMNACQRLDTRTNYHLGDPDFSCNHVKLDARGHNKYNCAREHK